MFTAEREAAGFGDREPGRAVADRGLERHGNAIDGVDEFLERAEVDLHEVIGLDAEVLADRVDQTLWIVTCVRLVDPALARAAVDLQPEVAREREDGDLIRRRVDAPHHDRVAALAGSLAVAERWRKSGVRVQAGVVVGARDQDVAGAGLGGWERLDRDVRIGGVDGVVCVLGAAAVDLTIRSARCRLAGSCASGFDLGRLVDHDEHTVLELSLGEPHEPRRREAADRRERNGHNQQALRPCAA